MRISSLNNKTTKIRYTVIMTGINDEWNSANMPKYVKYKERGKKDAIESWEQAASEDRRSWLRNN